MMSFIKLTNVMQLLGYSTTCSSCQPWSCYAALFNDYSSGPNADKDLYTLRK